MAKRFTDTDKWKNPGFRDMEPKFRWLWLYILDTCDAAGMWRVDFKMAEFCIGSKLSARESEEYFEDKILVIDHDKWLIPSFITFQYGELNSESRPHQSIIKILLKHGVDPKKLTLLEGYPRGICTPKEQEQEQEQIKEQVKERGSAEGDFKKWGAELYRKHPRKLGKADGLKRLVAKFKAGLTHADATAAQNRFLTHHKAAATEKDYLPYFSTWVGDLDDWLDPETGQADDFSQTNSLDNLILPDFGGG